MISSIVEGESTLEKYERAEAFFEVLNTNGVDSIFINPGFYTTPMEERR